VLADRPGFLAQHDERDGRLLASEGHRVLLHLSHALEGQPVTCRVAVRTEPVSAVQNQPERMACSPTGYFHVYYGDVCECRKMETLREIVRARVRA